MNADHTTVMRALVNPITSTDVAKGPSDAIMYLNCRLTCNLLRSGRIAKTDGLALVHISEYFETIRTINVMLPSAKATLMFLLMMQLLLG